jgi:spore coat polysaccharide biosynthesis predicted glycosyltransferase SpsG
MHVLILTEGGMNIGFGHLSRCCAIYEAFQTKGISSEFILNGDKTVKVLLKEKKYRIFNWLKEQKRLFSFLEDTDTVILDSYLAESKFYQRISETVEIPVYIDDYKRMDYPSGIVVNGNIYANAFKYAERKDTTYLLGTKYIPLRKEFWNIAEYNRYLINKEIRNILITFGGRGYSALAYRLINYLKDKFKFSFTVIDTEKSMVGADKMFGSMLSADICISGGGQTLYELARVGVPTVGICFADNQRLNLEGWREKNFIEYIGWHNDKNLLKKAASAINKLIPYRQRIRHSKIGRKYVDGRGAERITNELIKRC